MKYIQRVIYFDKAFLHIHYLLKGYATTNTYKALYKILLTIELIVLKYKNFTACYTAFALSSNQKGKLVDMEYTHIQLYINNNFNKLIKYQEFLT